MRKPSLLIIFLTVFIDLVGFGLIFPLLPLFGKNFEANGFTVGAIVAVYSLMQFIFAPYWGRLSDRIGRRPILMVSTACAAVAYCIFAVGSGMQGQAAIWVIIVSRLFAGICGANISVAQAYIADITPPEQRSAKMGLIGMAFGLGFVFGPALGGLSIHLFGMRGPGWVAASLSAINFVWILFMLPESRKATTEPVPHRPRWGQIVHTLSNPTMALLIGIFFLATFCFSSFETTIGLLVAKNFNLDIKSESGNGAFKISMLISYCAIIGALVQGGAIGKLVKRMGEPKLIAASLLIAGVGMVLIPYLHTWAFLLIGLGIFSIGSQLTRPPVFGMISQLTSASEQGSTLGVAQSIGSLARILGPMFAAISFDKHPVIPYVVCAVLSCATGVLAWKRLKRPVVASV